MNLVKLRCTASYLAGNFQQPSIVMSVQSHYERNRRVQKVIQTGRKNWHVNVLPGKGKQESSYALGHDHQFVEVGTPYEHLVLEEDAGKQLNDAVDSEPGEDVLERVVEQG